MPATLDYKDFGVVTKRWTPNTAYAAGTQIIAPTNEIVSSKVTFVSGATYLASDWDPNAKQSRVVTTVPTVVAGANAGTAPPVPVLQGVSNDTSGWVTFGTGTIPSAGNLVSFTFGTPYVSTPTIIITPVGGSTAGLVPFVQNTTVNGFSVALNSAPAASQVNTFYGVNYRVN